MKNSKIVALLLSMVLFSFTMVPLASATDAAEKDIPVADSARRVVCTNCDTTLLATPVCLEEMILLGDDYHGTLTKCHMYLYGSHGAEVCTACGYVVERYGIHDCREYHITCSKGDYRVCPFPRY